MHGQVGLLSDPRAKRAATLQRYLAEFPLSCVHCFLLSIPSAVRPTLLRQMNMGSVTCAQRGDQAQHNLLGGTGKLSLTLLRLAGDRTQGLQVSIVMV